MNLQFKLFLICSLCFVVRGASDADEDRKTKAVACISLVKAALHHNDEYFNYVAYTINANNADDLIKKWTTNALLNCFNTISLLKSAELISRKSHINISPFAKENQEILAIEKFISKYGKETERLFKDFGKLESVMTDLNEELKSLDEMVSKKAREFVNQYKREEAQRQLPEEEPEERGYYENSNLNLSMVTKMNPTVKAALGVGILGVIALAFYLGFKALRKEPLRKIKKRQ